MRVTSYQDIDSWAPIGLDELSRLLEPVERPWWIAGGVAIDLFLGEQRREHHDVDVAILRSDLPAFAACLTGWNLMVPTGKWEGEPDVSRAEFYELTSPEEIDDDSGQAWCRRSPNAPWEFELLLAAGDSRTWQFKRDPSITLEVTHLGKKTKDGTPYLVPEVVLLHKASSTYQGEHTDADFEAALPHLSSQQRAWLEKHLDRTKPGHKWLDALRAATPVTSQ